MLIGIIIYFVINIIATLYIFCDEWLKNITTKHIFAIIAWFMIFIPVFIVFFLVYLFHKFFWDE